MSGCGLSCFPAKHATLVNNCYPTVPGQTTPRSNELSYLQFYAESRPEKLTKVGVYLEKKVEADVWKKRVDFIKVSMEIWKSLLVTSPSQVNLYADPLLKSITAVVNSELSSVYPDATATFCKFCEVNGKMTLLSDTELYGLHSKLIETFFSFAFTQNPDLNHQYRLRKCGIDALAAVGRSEILHNSENKTLFELIIPAFIFNISSPVSAASNTGPTLKRMSTIDEATQQITPEQLNALASHGIADISRLCSVIHLRFMMDSVFRYVDERDWWSKSEFVSELVQLASSSAQPQFRYIPVAVVLKLLESDNNIHSFVKMHCLVTILEAFLNRRQSLVGISVLEILNTLVLQLFALSEDKDSKETVNTDNPSSLAAQNRLIQTIGRLGSQIYYSDQIMDVLGYLVNKLRIGSKNLSEERIPISKSRTLVLQSMTQVLRSHHEQIKKKPNSTKATISLNVFTSTISLLLSTSPDVRLEFFFFLHELINGLGYHDRVSKSQESDFLASLHRALFDYASNTNNLPIDYMILLLILNSLYPGLGEQALIRTIPLIFRLQALEADEKDGDLYHHLALSGVVLQFLKSAGHEIPSQELATYVTEIQSKREVASQWLNGLEPCPVDKLIGFLNLSFKELAERRLGVTPLQIVDIFVDPEAVSEILTSCPVLRFTSDDTKRQLLEEYNPEASNYDFQESKFRIRPSRSVRSQRTNNEKPSIVITEPVKIVRIENLRDALATPNQESSEFDSDSDVQSPSFTTSKKSPRETGSRVDVNNLLQSINISSSIGRKSTTSLVSGPYQSF